MSIHEELAGAVRIVEAWPEVEQGEEYEMCLTDAEAHLVRTFMWGRFGTAQLPKLVTVSCDEH